MRFSHTSGAYKENGTAGERARYAVSSTWLSPPLAGRLVIILSRRGEEFNSTIVPNICSKNIDYK